MVAPPIQEGQDPHLCLTQSNSRPFSPPTPALTGCVPREVGEACFPGGTGPCLLHCAMPREGQSLDPSHCRHHHHHLPLRLPYFCGGGMEKVARARILGSGKGAIEGSAAFLERHPGLRTPLYQAEAVSYKALVGWQPDWVRLELCPPPPHVLGSFPARPLLTRVLVLLINPELLRPKKNPQLSSCSRQWSKTRTWPKQ